MEYYKSYITNAFCGFIFVLLFLTLGCDSNDNSESFGTISRVGNLNGTIADQIKAIENLRPYLGGSESSVVLDGTSISKLSDSERAGIMETYNAGYCIALLDPTNDEIAVLHQTVKSGFEPGTSSGSVLLAYLTCKKEDNFVGRAIHTPTPDFFNDLEESYRTAADLVVGDLLLPPEQDILANFRQEEGTSTNVANTKPAFTHLMSIPDMAGVYNSTIQGWAVYTCDKIDTGISLGCMSNPTNLDQYFITLEADWTPGSYWASGDDVQESGHICLGEPAYYIPGKWDKGSREHCDGKRKTYCGFFSYPRAYKVKMSAPKRSEGSIFQKNAVPSASGGKTKSFTSGFQFSFGGEIFASGPGLISSATWDNQTTTTVPELILEAGNFGNQGAFWELRYDPETVEVGDGDKEYGCLGNRKNALKDPVFGQTVDAKYSDAIQTVQWFACPTREGTGFEVEIVFEAYMSDSQLKVWFDKIDGCSPGGGDCKETIIGANFCECDADVSDYIHPANFTYAIPYPHPPTDCN